MKKTLRKIVTLLLVVTMIFGAMSTTVAAASDTLGSVTDKVSGVLGGDPAPDSGSVTTGWCDISYDDNGVTVVLTPSVDEIKGITTDELKSVLSIIIDAAKSLVVDELKDAILGNDDSSDDDNVDVESGTDKNNIWEKAFAAYIKNEYGSDDSANYVQFLKDVLADDSNVKLDAFIDYACKLLKSSVNLGMIKLEDLPASSEIEDKIAELFEDELNTRLNEEATNYISDYIAWLEGDDSVSIDASIKSLIDTQVKSYIKTEINDYIDNNFTVLDTSQDPVDNIIANYVEDEIKNNVDSWIKNYANNVQNDADVDRLINETISAWVNEIALNYKNSSFTNPIYTDSLKTEINNIVSGILDDNQAQTEIRNYWNANGKDELKKIIADADDYDELLDSVTNTAKESYKSTVSDKINEQLDEDNDIALTLREIMSDLDATDKTNLKAAINSKAQEKIGEIKDEAFVTVLGKTEAEIKDKINDVFIPRLIVKYDATVEELKSKPEGEFSYRELLSYIQSISLNGNAVYANGSFKVSAVKKLIADLPRLDEIANMADSDMFLSYDLAVVTDFGDIDFNITARLGGGYSYVRKLATFISDHVDFHIAEDGTVTLNVRVPELFAELVLRAANSDRIPDAVKEKIFGAFDTTPDDIYALVKSVTLDDLLLIFDYVDIEAILDHKLLSRFEKLDGLTEDQIKDKIKEYESYYNKLISYIESIYENRIPDAVKDKTLFDLYDGDGLFAYAGTHSVNIEAILTQINEKYGALIASFFDVSTVTASFDLSFEFEGINKIDYVVDDEVYLSGFLPAGADIEYFAGITEYNGEVIYGWADADGLVYTEMPDADITLYAILTPDIPDLPDIPDIPDLVWFDSHITPSVVEKTYDGEEVALKLTFADGFVLPEGVEISYQWIKATDADDEGEIIENATTDTIYIKNVADSGTYICVIVAISEEDMYFAFSISEICTVTINKATIDLLEEYKWKQDGDVYDGTEKSIYLYDKDGNKLTFGIKYLVNGEYTNVATNAGVYVAAIEIDEDNFVLVGIPECEWEIKKAVYDMSGVRFDDKTVKYDGQPHSITIDESKLPDGVDVEYSGNAYVEPGKYEITATFIGSSNYEDIAPMTATLTIIGYNKNPQSIKDSDGKLIVEIIPENGVLEIYNLSFKDVTTNYTRLESDSVFGEGKVGIVGGAYDIHFVENGIEQPVNDNFSVKLLIPAALRNSEKTLMVVYIADNDITDMKATRDGDYMLFNTTHFSVYAIVEVDDAPKAASDVDLTWLWILIAVLAAIIIAIVIIIIIIKKRTDSDGNEPVAAEPTPKDEPEDNAEASEEIAVEETTEEAPAVEETTEETPVAEETVEEVPAEEPKVVPTPVIKVSEEEGEGERIINGEVVHVRYRTSFMSRLIQAEEPIQDYYTVVKNALLSYKGVKARTSWNFESFNKGRIQCAKLNVKGSAFQVYLGLDPNEYNANKYHFIDVSDKPKLDKVPMLLKVKSERGLKYVLELIEEMMNKLGMERIETPNVDYHMPYETTEALAERDLVKVILPAGVTLDGDENLVKVDVGELIDNANAEKAEREASATIEENVVSKDTTVAEESTAEEPAPEESAAEETVAKESVTEEFVIAEEPAAEEPVAETPAEEVPSAEPVEEVHVDAVHADEIISDEEAKTKIDIVEKAPAEKSKSNKQSEINLDTICENFEDGEVVNLSALKARRLISGNVGRIKVLARGVMTKKLTIYADKFSLQAVKMITLAGGHAEQYK